MNNVANADDESRVSLALSYTEVKKIGNIDLRKVTNCPDGHVQKRVDAVSCGILTTSCSPFLSTTVLSGISMVAVSTAFDWK